MVNNIRFAFDEILGKVQWMDKETLGFAKQKLAAMTTHIGYPVELGNDAILDQYYTGLDIDCTKYLESVLNVNTFDTNYTLGQLREVVNKTDWVKHSNAATVGAYYRSTENSIRMLKHGQHCLCILINCIQFINKNSRLAFCRGDSFRQIVHHT